MSEPFIAQIMMFGGNFAPRGWAFCSGQLLAIAQNSALFSLLGTTYGGDGVTTFALPDLRGRVPLHPGQGPGLSNYTLGEQAGQETVTLLVTQMPAHNHSVNATNAPGDRGGPGGDYLAGSQNQGPDPNPLIYNAGPPNKVMHPNMITSAGGSQPHENRQPFLAVNFIIALEGIYPSQA
jgi:microcystin-dependent protein